MFPTDRLQKSKKIKVGTHVEGSTVSGCSHFGAVVRLHPGGSGRALIKLHHPYTYGDGKISYLWVNDIKRYKVRHYPKPTFKRIKIRKSAEFFKAYDPDLLVLHWDDIPTYREVHFDEADDIGPDFTPEPDRADHIGAQISMVPAPHGFARAESQGDLDKGNPLLPGSRGGFYKVSPTGKVEYLDPGTVPSVNVPKEGDRRGAFKRILQVLKDDPANFCETIMRNTVKGADEKAVENFGELGKDALVALYVGNETWRKKIDGNSGVVELKSLVRQWVPKYLDDPKGFAEWAGGDDYLKTEGVPKWESA